MKMITNFFGIIPSKDRVFVPYLDLQEQQISILKKDNPHAIFLRSRDMILFWGAGSFSPDGSLEIDKNKNHYLFLKVLAHGVLEQFFLSTATKVSKKNYVYRLVSLDQDISKNKYLGVQLNRAFYLHFTPYHVNSSMILGFTISSSVVGRITWTKQDFATHKIQYDDLPQDKETGDFFATPSAIYRLANHFNYSSQIKQDFDFQNSIQKEHVEINNFVREYFRKDPGKFLLPDGLHIKAIDESAHLIGAILPAPESYFYKGIYPNRKNNFHQRKKISYNKPFTYDKFENRTINISVIYPEPNYEDVRRFLSSVQKELLETFRFGKQNFKYTKVPISSFALRDYQQELASISKDTDIVIVVVDQAHEALHPRESPYYFCKAEFIKRGINTQEVQIQQIRQFLTDQSSQKPNYTHHNIALNIYAKLGGMAWTIKPNEQKNELVIGIGATTDPTGQPILGLTAIFRGDGKYVLGKASSVTNMVDYRRKLEQIISSTIESSIKDGILDVDKTIYLVFHIFKPAGKDNEIEALEGVIKKFSQYSFKYAFVHIGENHNYRFFTSEEIDEAAQSTLINVLAQNHRGTLIEITPTRGFLGLRNKSSTFFKIDIHQNSNLVDLRYIAEQVYQFAEMSHTSYNKQGTPITIKYPNLMARFVEKFNEGNLMYLEEVAMPDHSLWFI